MFGYTCTDLVLITVSSQNLTYDVTVSTGSISVGRCTQNPVEGSHILDAGDEADQVNVFKMYPCQVKNADNAHCMTGIPKEPFGVL